MECGQDVGEQVQNSSTWENIWGNRWIVRETWAKSLMQLQKKKKEMQFWAASTQVKCSNQNSTLIRPPLGCHALFWAPLFRKDIDHLECAQRRATKMRKSLERRNLRGKVESAGPVYSERGVCCSQASEGQSCARQGRVVYIGLGRPDTKQ